jgi:steroid 5-alpha reductase family enzyme
MNPYFMALWAWLAMILVMSALFLVQRSTKNAGIVDAGWAFGVGAVALFYALVADGDGLRRIFLVLLVGAWSLRLGIFIMKDRVIGAPEDGRYKAMRDYWGAKAEPYMFLFYQAQAFWTVLFSVPFLPVVFNATPGLTGFDIAGIVVFFIALAGESLADRQLAAFKKRPDSKGKTCREGLWRYSRHPNYFFEWIHWFAYPLLALPGAGFWIAMAGPVVVLFFLYKVTGIPYTEKQALKSRGDDYRRYQESTSAFIPWFPKEESK